jgi:hypothetical protein
MRTAKSADYYLGRLEAIFDRYDLTDNRRAVVREVVAEIVAEARQIEREWCADLVQSPAATHLEMVAIYEREGKDPKTFRTHANALIEAAKAIRESGRFRDSIEAGKAGHLS